MTRVLAIGHETPKLAALAGGTLAKFAEREDVVFIAEVTPASAKRGREQRDSVGKVFAQAVGAEWLGSLTLDSGNDGRSLRDPVMDVIRKAKPDVIIAPALGANERLPLAELVFNAAYCSTIPNYLSPTGLEAASVRAPIFAMDQPLASDYEPDTYVDISEQWARKVELMELYENTEANGNLRDLAEVASRARGVQVHVEFAEAFRIERVWGRLRPYRLLP